ncbi:MAG: RluA family pseudouridine synthase [Limnochordia bacterium]|jgi:23S rRNA pseudouridine1911/1915/1917 synthase
MPVNRDPSRQPRLLRGTGIPLSASRRIISLIVPPAAAGQRLDVFLATCMPSRSWAQRLIAGGRVLIDGQTARRASQRLTGHERLSFPLPPHGEEGPDIVPEAIPLDIVYEDQYIAVINKPKGMVVHPGAGHTSGTLVNALLHRYGSSLSGLGGAERPGIVHRLDKDTSGCLIVARTDEAHRGLAEQLRTRSMRRTYVALVHGIPPSEGTIRLPIGRHPIHRVKMAVLPAGRHAVTRFRLLESLGSYGLVQVELETGRTHQIRVHLAHIGFPVVGDALYARGRPKVVSNGQALHAWQVAFRHPQSRLQMICVAPPPRSFAELLASLRDAAKN